MVEQRLASFEAHPGTLLARSEPGLSGGSRALWDEAEGDVARARAVFHEVTRLVDGVAPRTAVGRLPTVNAAIDAVQRALVLAGRIEVARTRLVPRARRAEARAADAGEPAAATRAGELAERITSDPLAEHESALHDVEQEAASAGRSGARSRLARLRELVDEAAEGSDHAAGRYVGFASSGAAVRDGLAELERWLRRIEEAGPASPEPAGGEDLAPWTAAADALEKRAVAAQTEASAADDQLDDLRGIYRPLDERAGRCGRREEPEIDALLQTAEAHLWSAPFDLGIAEAMLVTVTELLDGRGREPGS